MERSSVFSIRITRMRARTNAVQASSAYCDSEARRRNSFHVDAQAYFLRLERLVAGALLVFGRGLVADLALRALVRGGMALALRSGFFATFLTNVLTGRLILLRAAGLAFLAVLTLTGRGA